METSIRPYQQSDKDQVLKLIDEFQDYLISIDPLKRNRRVPGYNQLGLQSILDDVKEKQGKFLVAEHNDDLVGFIVALVIPQSQEELTYIIPSTIGRIIELYINAIHRGKGLGTLLIKAAEEYLTQKNCDVIWIEVFEPNTNATQFYTDHGYRVRMLDMIKKIK